MTAQEQMTMEEHRDVYQAIAESIVAEPKTSSPTVPGVRTLDPRVERGVALLDEQHPGWAKKIDLKTFRLSSASDCVLGQLYHGEAMERDLDDGYEYGTNYLFPGDRQGIEAMANGFEIQNRPTHEEMRDAYAELEADWRIVIEERQRS